MHAQAFTVSTPDGEIHGWREGHGPELLHGGPGLSDNVAPLAGLLGRAFTTIRYQQRGLPPTTITEPYTVEAHVRDAEAVVAQAAGGRAWMIGFSWGGHLALHLLVARPELFTGAIIIDPLGVFVDAMDEFGERLVAGVPAELQDRLAELDAREDEGQASAEESQELQRIVWLGYFANPATAPPRPPMRTNPKCGSDTIASIRAHGEQATLERGLPLAPVVPLLFIHGRQSPMPVRTTTETAALLPHAQAELIDDAGHYLFLEQPERTLSAITRFVDAVRAASSRDSPS